MVSSIALSSATRSISLCDVIMSAWRKVPVILTDCAQ